MAKLFRLNTPYSASPEDVLKALSKKTGLPMDRYKIVTNAVDEKRRVYDIISDRWHILKDDGSVEALKKADELIDLGRFIADYNHIIGKEGKHIVIVDSSYTTEPDFIIEYKGERIGIEHTRLVDEKLMQQESNINNLLSSVKKILLGHDNKLTGVFNIELNKELVIANNRKIGMLKPPDKNIVANQIADYIRFFNTDCDFQKPEYILGITYFRDDILDVRLGDTYDNDKAGIEDKLQQIINTKESKIKRCIESGIVAKCWLLITTEVNSPAGCYKIQDLSKFPTHNQVFEVVILHNKDTHKIFASPVEYFG